jgi:hypothetical protein
MCKPTSCKPPLLNIAQDVDEAMNHVWRRRRLVQFTSLAGLPSQTVWLVNGLSSFGVRRVLVVQGRGFVFFVTEVFVVVPRGQENPANRIGDGVGDGMSGERRSQGPQRS